MRQTASGKHASLIQNSTKKIWRKEQSLPPRWALALRGRVPPYSSCSLCREAMVSYTSVSESAYYTQRFVSDTARSVVVVVEVQMNTIRIDELPGCCDVVRCVDYIVAKFRALSVQSWRRSEPTVYDKIVTLYLINSNSPWNFGSLFSRRFGTARMGLYGRRPSQPRPILAVPNVTAHPSTASIGLQITVLLYNGPLLCGFNAPIKGVNRARVTGQDDPLPVTVLDHVCYCVCDDVC